MTNDHRRDKINGPKPKPDMPYDAMPGIRSAAARIACVPLHEIGQTGSSIEGAKARSAMIMALVDASIRFDEIAMAVHCDRGTITRTRQRWNDSEPTQKQQAVYRETARLIAEALNPRRKRDASIFVQPGQAIPMPQRRTCPTGAEMMALFEAQQRRSEMIRRLEYPE